VTHALGGTTLDGTSYTLDNAGNRTAKSDLYTGVTTNYGYDGIYELLSATQSGSATESYTYDPVGNRLSNLAGSGWSYNTSNELNSRPSISYTYDANGNTLTKTDSTGTTNYSWDFENRLSSVTLPGSGGMVSFKYDPFGRRIEKISPTATSIFAYDRSNLVETVNASGGVVARYTQTQNIDEPLAELRGTTTDYYEADGLGSVSSLTDTTGALAQTYTYDSFGNTVATSGTLRNYFQYTGREFDTETNLYFYRARYYDPQSGRFLSEDPLGFGGNGTNFYAYAGNDPIGNVDPSGCGFIDCVKALAELADALKDLAQREAENAAAGKCDPGHDKAIQQAKNRVANAVAKAAKCIPADEAQRILDSLKQLGEDLGNKIWNWLNNDPRQNWPSIYGPPGGSPVPLPLPVPVPVPVPI
jgi:RHS repeat-associated protein